MTQKFLFFILSFLISSSSAWAAIHHTRWTQQYGLTGQLQTLLPKLNHETGSQMTANDFSEFENIKLAHYHFVTYRQLFKGVPVKGAVIRTWEDLQTGHLVLMEAHLEDGQEQPLRLSSLRKHQMSLSRLQNRLSVKSSFNLLARQAVLTDDLDSKVANVQSEDQWNGNDLERVIRISAGRGYHTFVYSHFTKKLKVKTYKEYPRADIPALVYPIYEEAEKSHAIQNRTPALLKNLNAWRRDFGKDAYTALKSRKYLYSLLDEDKGLTPEGQADGYWSFRNLQKTAGLIHDSLALVPNTIEGGGIYLEGKYATVNIHPAAAQFPGLQTPLKVSDQFMFNWIEGVGPNQDDAQITIESPWRTQPLLDLQSALNRVARRLPDNDPATYLADGFDEIQVYYAMNTLMESLQAMGFSDPELSTRPFHAFLYNPDIENRDNAFYTDDTINFSTYSPDSANMARDNPTIWHEMGHGIMDRLMGPRIELADTGGLSEGMADFVAQLVIQDVTKGVPFDGSDEFRINNKTGFYMTNEVHDDGEAYGGAMRDILMGAWAKDGHAGLVKVADLTLDAMRLARNHPALTANDWFDAMLFADDLGQKGLRVSGEMHSLIVSSLQNRNFRFDRGEPAQLILAEGGQEITDSSEGSRGKPFVHHLKPNETAIHDVEISVKNSNEYRFQFPLKVEVVFNDWALQGAVKWQDEAVPQTFVLANEDDKIQLKLTALSGCDFVNTSDDSCKDYALVRVYNSGETQARAKKRFYVRIYNDSKMTLSSSDRRNRK